MVAEVRERSLKNELREIWEINDDLKRLGQLDCWPVYDSPLCEYRSFFKAVDKTNWYDHIHKQRAPVAIDLMASTAALRDLFHCIPSDRSRVGIAVSLEDLRTDEQKAIDRSLGLVQVSGDLTKTATWRQVSRTLASRKAHLIFERAQAGLMHLPKNKLFYSAAVSRIWDMLDDSGGILLMQLPSIPINEWVGLLRANGLDVNYARGALRLIKTPESPKNLPF